MGKEEGQLIQKFDPKPAIQTYAETADWPYREEAKVLYEIGKEMDRRFFNGLVYPDGSKVPAPAIAFDDLRNKNTIACYDLFPDEYGIVGKITFNTAHYEEQDGGQVWVRGRYSQGETLLHEYIHLWQQIGRGKDPYKQAKHKRDFHNKEFVAFAEQLGLHPTPGTGVHKQIATLGSPIDILLKDMGITRPEKANEKPEDDNMNWADWLIAFLGGEKQRKGRSTLSKWECECGQKARVGTKEFDATCNRCGTVFVKMDGKAHNIYKS